MTTIARHLKTEPLKKFCRGLGELKRHCSTSSTQQETPMTKTQCEIHEIASTTTLRLSESGASIPKRYYVVRTKFHDGGIISEHRSLNAAARAAQRASRGSCQCGCAGVVADFEYDDLPFVLDGGNASDLVRA